MLKKFSVENFKNFKEKFEFDLTNTKNYDFNKECLNVGGGILKKAVIYGPNAIGKSNLCYAIFELQRHLCDIRPARCYENFQHASRREDLSSFSYFFDIEGLQVSYLYEKDSNQELVYEELFIDGDSYLRFKIERGKPIYDHKLAGTENLQLDGLFASGVSVSSFVRYVRKNTKLPDNKINRAFLGFYTFVERMLFFSSLHENTFIGRHSTENFIDAIIRTGNVDKYEKFLNECEIHVELKVVEAADGQKQLMADFQGSYVHFREIWSTGTRSLSLFFYWYMKKHELNYSLLFIDEFDAFFHHAVSKHLIEILKENEFQSILTTHNTSLMTTSLMRPDCYFIMNRDSIRSLPDCTDKELRQAHNLEKMYRAGSFYVPD